MWHYKYNNEGKIIDLSKFTIYEDGRRDLTERVRYRYENHKCIEAYYSGLGALKYNVEKIYDSNNHLIKDIVQKPNTKIAITYSYNSNGLMTEKTDGYTTWSYDSNGQLVAIKEGGKPYRKFSYDTNGSIQSIKAYNPHANNNQKWRNVSIDDRNLEVFDGKSITIWKNGRKYDERGYLSIRKDYNYYNEWRISYANNVEEIKVQNVELFDSVKNKEYNNFIEKKIIGKKTEDRLEKKLKVDDENNF